MIVFNWLGSDLVMLPLRVALIIERTSSRANVMVGQPPCLMLRPLPAITHRAAPGGAMILDLDMMIIAWGHVGRSAGGSIAHHPRIRLTTIP